MEIFDLSEIEESAIVDAAIRGFIGNLPVEQWHQYCLPVVMDREELRERTMQFAVRAVKFCRVLSSTWDGRRIAGQLIDSATSTAMNYRAAGRGRSRAEFIAKLGLVAEEADESAGWLELITRLEMSTDPELRWLRQESQELCAIFGQSQKTARENFQRARSRSQIAKS